MSRSDKSDDFFLSNRGGPSDVARAARQIRPSFSRHAPDGARDKLRAIFGLSLANFAKLRAFLALSFIIVGGMRAFWRYPAAKPATAIMYEKGLVLVRKEAGEAFCTKSRLFSYEKSGTNSKIRAEDQPT